MEQPLPHRAVVHWQAAQTQVDNERGFAQLVSGIRVKKVLLFHSFPDHIVCLIQEN